MDIKIYTKNTWKNSIVSIIIWSGLFLFGVYNLFYSKTISQYIFSVICMLCGILAVHLVYKIKKGKEDCQIIQNIDRYEEVKQ